MALLQTLDEWTARPPYAATIDRAHPLGALARFVLVAEERPVEVCRGIRASGGTGTMVGTPDGKGYVLPVTATTVTSQVADLDPKISGVSMTIGWYGLLRDNVNQWMLRAESGYGWGFYTDGWSPGNLRLQLLRTWGGGGFTSGSFPVTDNSLHSVMAVYSADLATVDMYLDGRLIGSGAWSADAALMGAGQFFSIKGHTTKPAAMLTVQAFAGAFTAGQIQSWADNPWQIFEADEYFLPAPSADITLVGAPGALANTGGTGAIGQTHQLTGAAGTQANVGTAVPVGQTHELTGAAGTQASAGSTAALGQTHQLAGAAGTQENAGGTGAILIEPAIILADAPGIQYNAGGLGIISQTHVLTSAPSVQDNIAAASAIVQTHLLAAEAGIQVNGAGVGAISQPGVAIPVEGPAGSGGRRRLEYSCRPSMGRAGRPRQ